MNDTTEYYREVSRLRGLARDGHAGYMSAPWLESDFDAKIWSCNFKGVHRNFIDFRITLDDGSRLTDVKNAGLLFLFKAWLCSQSQPSENSSVAPAAAAQYNRVSRCLGLVDYFLINSANFQLGKFGLSLVTAQDIQLLVFRLVSSSKSDLSIYEWPKRLNRYLAKCSQEVDVAKLTASAPFLAVFQPSKHDLMGIVDPETIVRYRAYLWEHNFYTARRSNRGSEGTRYQLNTRKLALHIYANTLRGKRAFFMPPELLISPRQTFRGEYEEVPVTRTDGDRILDKSLSLYRGVLGNLDTLDAPEVNIPASALKTIGAAFSWGAESAQSTGRFTTVPPSVVLHSLRHAIEFYLKFGEALIDKYLSLAEVFGPQERLTASSSEEFGFEYSVCLPARMWCLSGAGVIDRHKPESKDEYFRKLRLGKGFWELMMVLYGAIQITFGTLTARRVSEILGLPADKCLDRSGKYLVFANAKSGHNGMRANELRPIPPIVSRMVKSLVRLQTGLIQLQHLDGYTSLFARPNKCYIGLSERRRGYNNNRCLDLFCDYVEVPCDMQGRRYYIRTHQLRRFFAMAFFWSGAPGGPDVLRWFLAHNDPEHLYRYITEETPGAALKSVKANYTCHLVRESDHEVSALTELLERHFGARRFSVLTDSELEEYIEELMAVGKISIEPQFIKLADGRQFRTLVKVN